MSTLTLDWAGAGKALFEGARALRPRDDQADRKAGGAYAHCKFEFSATEANEWLSLWCFVRNVVWAGGGALKVRNASGATLPAGPVRVTSCAVASVTPSATPGDHTGDGTYFTIAASGHGLRAGLPVTLAGWTWTGLSDGDFQVYDCPDADHFRIVGPVFGSPEAVGAIQHDHLLVEAATAAGNAPADALLLAPLADGAVGVAYCGGDLPCDTSGQAIGATAYLAAEGGVTFTPPSGADQIVQELGHVKAVGSVGLVAGFVRRPRKIGSSWLQDRGVTYAKLQNVSATDRLLGRSSAGAGGVEEIACTAAGRALLADADAAAQRATLGLAAFATRANLSGASLDGARSIYIQATAPSNPVAGDLWFDTGDTVYAGWWRYDGARWVSLQVFTAKMDGLQQLTTSSTTLRLCAWEFGTLYAIQVCAISSYLLPVTANDASNHWTLKAAYESASGYYEVSNSPSFNTAALAVGVKTQLHAVSAADVLTPSASAALICCLSVQKTGSPNGLYLSPAVSYRLVHA